MADKYQLSSSELSALRTEHRRTGDRRSADRLKAVYLLGSGWSARDVSKALLMDEDTVRAYFKRYRKGGVRQLLRVDYLGSESRLSEAQLVLLDRHLECNLFLTVKEVVEYVAQRFAILYSVRGMTELLHRLGYVYKKPKLVPGKADPQAQLDHLERYEELKQNKGENDRIYFMDAAHPQHNPVAGYGWIKRGKTHPIPTNTGRRRLNINGAIDLERLEPVARFDDTINAASTVALFEQIEAANPKAERIYVICDNARYYRSKEVSKYLKTSKIELVFLPPYSPNLNLIERFWKFFKKQILYDTYYATFDEFKSACEGFFRNVNIHAASLRSLLTENFQIIEI